MSDHHQKIVDHFAQVADNIDQVEDLGPQTLGIMTDREMAKDLGVPLSTLRWWWNQGKGPPSFRIGKHRRGFRASFLRYLKQLEDSQS